MRVEKLISQNIHVEHPPAGGYLITGQGQNDHVVDTVKKGKNGALFFLWSM
jgi:hypothetical protein